MNTWSRKKNVFQFFFSVSTSTNLLIRMILNSIPSRRAQWRLFEQREEFIFKTEFTYQSIVNTHIQFTHMWVSIVELWVLTSLQIRHSRFCTTVFTRVHATPQPALSVGRSVGWLVGWSRYFFYHFYFFETFLAILSNLKAF